jgi:hypothetical protein
VIVAFDAGMLSILIHPGARVPDDPETGEPLERAKERIEHLVATLEEEGSTIVIPTPALAEFLVLADEAGATYLRILHTHASFDVRPFDEMAAIDCAESQRRALATGDKKSGAAGSAQKIKVDRQIVAIATSLRADRIYTTDRDVVKIAAFANLPAIALWDLPLPLTEAAESEPPPHEHQVDLFSENVRAIRLPEEPNGA